MLTFTLRVFTILWLALALTTCAHVGQVNNNNPIELRLMSFNIEWGGARVSFEKVIEAIQLSNADIVGIQEAEGNLQGLADKLGWQYNLRNYVISKYPIIEPSGAKGKYVYVEVRPGKVVAIANVHLPSDPYGPDAVREGASPAEVLEIEKLTRLPGIAYHLAPLPALVAEGIPVFITGDFNAPAHTDWTEAMVGVRKFIHYSLAWPVSQAVVAAGFKDSWRSLHPDPFKNPGLTWWAGRPPLPDYAPGEDDAQDRIDFIWFAGPAEARDSKIVGEFNGPEVSIALTPWPSDHRAVLSEFLVVPANMPDLVTTDKRVYQAGTQVNIVFNSSGETTITLAKKDSAESLMTKRLSSGKGEWSWPASQVVPGHYQLRMQQSTSKVELSKDFWVLENDAVPEVNVIGTSFESGEGFDVQWRNAPGNRNDYLAAYAPNVTTDYDNGIAWSYIDALPNGEKRLDETTSSWGWPLAPGEYVIRLVKDDGYEVLAESASFTIEP